MVNFDRSIIFPVPRPPWRATIQARRARPNAYPALFARRRAG
jgi:hypothetical protein